MVPRLYKLLIFVDNYRGIKSRSRPHEENSQGNDNKVDEIDETVDTNNYIYLEIEEIIEIVEINKDTYLRTDYLRNNLGFM